MNEPSQNIRRTTSTGHTTRVLLLLACAAGFAGCFDIGSGPPTGRAASIELVSGDNQTGKVGEPLEEPLIVRARNSDGSAANNVPIRWTVVTGASVFPGAINTLTLYTDETGVVWMPVTPMRVGEHTVRAGISDASVAPVTFHVTARNVFVVSIFEGNFVGPGPDAQWSSHIIVPVGATVEWVNLDSWTQYTVSSTSAPAGGTTFDSSPLGFNQRFQFVPNVAGTWDYRDTVHGRTGRLSAE